MEPGDPTRKWSIARIVVSMLVVEAVYFAAASAGIACVLMAELVRNPAIDVDARRVGLLDDELVLSLGAIFAAIACLPAVRRLVSRCDVELSHLSRAGDLVRLHRRARRVD